MKIKKSLLTAVIAVILTFACATAQLKVARASEGDISTHASVLAEGHQAVTLFINGGASFTADNVDELIGVTSLSLLSAEYLKGAVTEIEYDSKYRNAHTDVLQVCKNAHIWKMENGYDPSIYPSTDGGLTLVRQKLGEYSSTIRLATEYSQITSAYTSWVAFIEGGGIALKVNSLSSGGTISVNLSSPDLIFAEDDVVGVKEFNDTVIIKNTSTALYSSGKLKAEDSGIAYYLSLSWSRNGVILEGDKVPSSQVVVSIELKDLGLENATDIQVARYLGKESVSFIENAKVEDGYLTFTLESFGTDIESDYSLDFAIVAKGYKTASRPYLIYVGIGVGAILLLTIVIQMICAIKKRKRKKQYKAFVKANKLERKNKKTKTIEE